MNRVLAEVNVPPLYGQVVVQDPGTADLPEWETGEERAIGSEHAVYVATRADTDGGVTIRVVEGLDTGGLGDCVFDGDLSMTSPRLEVGNPIAAVLESVVIGGAGYVHLRVFVRPLELPAEVGVLIEPRDSTKL